MGCEQIERELNAEVERFRALVDRTRDEFSFRLSEIPAGKPSPDAIQQSGAAYRNALRAYLASLRRWNNFLMEGEASKEMSASGDR